MRLEELERAEKMRLEELVKEQALKEKELQLKFDLERFKIESGFSGDAKKGEDEGVIIVSSDAEDEILIPALQEYVPELALLRVTRENFLINAQKIARRLNPYTNRQPVKAGYQSGLFAREGIIGQNRR
ncbi:hypothetical protein TNCV_1603611 [Trichonephila clavipes]|nr:hypothetical protein TNCV_1603611 [Trichonephila clavipes]